ncbi:hypothetical protein F5Y14DRAFT_224019 [Nemania sp. NC0429]|nr:hypothetical protein F5Y14DRAFT_224019 [Nemania sp. NC0429]
MGKPNTRHGDSLSDAVSLHSNIGEGSTIAPYVDEDAPEIDINDLPPNYSDAVESSEAAPMLAPGHGVNNTPRPLDLDAKVVIDQNSGAQAWVARSAEDPAALETYIRRLAVIPPRPYVKLIGTHRETTRDRKDKQETNIVTDFNVTVELTPYLFADAQYRTSWSQLRTVDGSEKVHRGTIRAKRDAASHQGIEAGTDPRPTLQEWCHRFAASPAALKCFTFRRQMVGFDKDGVKRRLEELVRRTNYRGQLSVQFITQDAQIHLYNDTKINRWRLTPWIRWLFILTLTFLFSWPYLLLRTKRWEVAVAEWPFSRVDEFGNKEYVSISEEQWYNMWAQAICRAVLEKRQTLLDQSDLRRAHEPGPVFNTGNTNVDGALGLFQAGVHAMNEVNRQLGWGGDC